MHLQSLKIKSFRNLQDIEIHFDEKFTSHAIIGQNGSGKSNLFEAIITIFRDLDLQNSASLDYEMKYLIRGHVVSIEAMIGKQPEIIINGNKKTPRYLTEHAKEYLPSHIFAYYSGKNDRIERLFQSHIKKYNKLERSFDEEVLNEDLLNPDISIEERNILIQKNNPRNTEEKLKKRNLRDVFSIAEVVILNWFYWLVLFPKTKLLQES